MFWLETGSSPYASLYSMTPCAMVGTTSLCRLRMVTRASVNLGGGGGERGTGMELGGAPGPGRAQIQAGFPQELVAVGKTRSRIQWHWDAQGALGWGALWG